MAKYIDADRLKAEIKRRIDATINIHHTPCHRREELEGLLSFIDSLQQEQPNRPDVDFEKAALNFAEEIGVPVSDTFLSIARHFSELGQRKAAEMYDEIEYNRQRAEGEMLDKTLDEAAEKGAYNYCVRNEIGESIGAAIYDAYETAFKAGAKWMAGQGKIFDGEVISTSDNNWECIRIYEKIHSVGDKVIVQIRKKEESK